MTTMRTEPYLASPADLRELHVPSGIPGFPDARHFTVRPWTDDGDMFLVLECREVPGVNFVVMRPSLFFPWYEPRFPADVYQAVEASGPDEILVLVMLTLGHSAAEATANLLGPLVVNPATGTAIQAVLAGSGLRTKTPLVGAEPPLPAAS